MPGPIRRWFGHADFRLESDRWHGQLLDPPGVGARIEFTPDPAFAGVAEFAYTIADDQTAAEIECRGRDSLLSRQTRRLHSRRHRATCRGNNTNAWIGSNADGHLDVSLGGQFSGRREWELAAAVGNYGLHRCLQ